MQQAEEEEEALQIHVDAVGKEFTNGPNVYTESTAVKELNFPQKRAKIINTFCSFPLLKVSPPPPRNFPRKGEGGFPPLLLLPFPFSTGEKRAADTSGDLIPSPLSLSSSSSSFFAT